MGLYWLCRVCSLGVYSRAARKHQLLCLEFSISTSSSMSGTATNFAHLIRNEQRTLLDFQWIWFVHYLFSSQWKTKKETFEVSLLYRKLWFWRIEVNVKTVCYFHSILPTGFAHLLAWNLIRIGNIRVKITVFINEHLIENLLEFVASALSRDVEKNCKIWRNLAKCTLKFARGNSWRKWVVLTSLPSLVCILFRSRKPVWHDDIVCPVLSRAQPDKIVLWRPNTHAM